MHVCVHGVCVCYHSLKLYHTLLGRLALFQLCGEAILQGLEFEYKFGSQL